MSSTDITWLGLSPGDAIAGCALFIAVLALAATIFQAYIGVKHNKLSVKPYLDLCWKTTTDYGLGCELKNYGLGTAIIKKVVYLVDGSEFPVNSTNDFKCLLVHLAVDISSYKIEFRHIQEHSALSAGDTDELFRFSDNPDNANFITELSNQFTRLEIQVEYECIYGKTFKSIPCGLGSL
ncbi:hypothetical protein [Vibrio cholerae]|uniref:hypothetical protein n=1 Tax=Vibrio cholerae TaxID=666 RepID=UPI0000EF8BFD|nr:hypothetical protein [Vibrio cholerae]EAZ74541.1 hypothetical protein A5C_A0458 [Vibrio cholerae NCTC 8457]APF65833.1 hypothetical protein ASZ87_03167 [Vibrio cholerae]APF69622.1 hypothetical protein ASZ88_03282 [Vibrio cholerae]APF69674.1 hypothetical protein ASZ88_03334 [Vibrio cholerae]EFH78178.1 conserved hypothetical protein [Vibrio cholerae MAK 757]